MKAIFHPEAHQEMIESARFYEEKSRGLGADFLTAVENTTRRIEQNPEAGPITSQYTQAACVRFPVHNSLRNTARSNFPRCRHAPTTTAWLLEDPLGIERFSRVFPIQNISCI
ncbi:MAG TPA: hypothetical protein DC047_20350 [Blastocatellia bacterium]|nr:hypothetical protein [Blastocatellia bacterium]